MAYVTRLGNLVLAAVCAWGVAYILVTLSVIGLRRRRPDLPRPYRIPAYPLPQIVALVGITTALAYIAPLGCEPPERLYSVRRDARGYRAIRSGVDCLFVRRRCSSLSGLRAFCSAHVASDRTCQARAAASTNAVAAALRDTLGDCPNILR